MHVEIPTEATPTSIAQLIMGGIPKKCKDANRAVYNLTVRHIILPLKNLTVSRQVDGILDTLVSFLKEARVWIFTVGGS